MKASGSKGSWIVVALASAATLLVGCGGGGGTGPSENQLEGTWRATRIEYTRVSDPSTKEDIVPSGATATLTLSSGGSCSLASTIPGEAPVNLSGTWTSSVDVLTIHWSSPGVMFDWEFDMTLSGDTLTLAGADSEFAFTQDGQDEPAKLTLVLVRQ